MMRIRFCGLVVVTTILSASSAHAQGFIQDLFREVDRVGFHIPTLSDFSGNALIGNGKVVGGLGLRVSYALVRSRRVVGDSFPAQEIYLQLEYSRFTGFKDKLSGIGLRGTFEEFPTIGVYGLKRFGTEIGIYTGVHVGITKLDDFQGFDDFDTKYSADATSFAFGSNAGLVIGVTNTIQTFLEFNQTYRQFNSVKWGIPDGTTQPDELPRSLPANSSQVRFGLQIVLR